MSKDNAYVRDILDSAQFFRLCLQGITWGQFEASQEKQDSVIRRYEIIEEAGRRLSPAVKSSLPDVPWRL